jgi:PAS domain S-box-containing protein
MTDKSTPQQGSVDGSVDWRRQAEEEIKRLKAAPEQRVAEQTAQLDSANRELYRLNRTLKVVSECNQALIHAEEESAFLYEVCRIIVGVGGYCMAWVGYAEQDEAKQVRPVAHAGFEEGYLASAGITWADDARGSGPTGTAIRTGRPTVNRNTETDSTVSPWREEQLKRGYACSIGLPFRAGLRFLGALTLYAAEPDAFDDEEIKLLSELAADIGFGIDTIRTRAERKRTAEALQESETRYKTFISHSTEGVWRVELAKPLPIGVPEDESVEWLFQHGYMAECNQAFARIVGFSTPEELIGKRLRDLISASDEGRIESFRSLVRGDFQSRTVEFRAPDKAGNVRYFLRTEIPIVENGMLVRLWCITRDLSELKRAEEAVRKTSAETRDLYNNAPCGYHSLDKDGLVLRMNETELRWLGYTREEVIGKLNFADVLTENSREVFAKSFPRFKETGFVRDLEFELVRKDGSVFPVLVSATAVRDESGNYVMSRSTLYDMTEKKRAQEAVTAERQRFNDVLEMLPAYVVLLTPDYHVPFANRFFRERFGESHGKRCYEYLFGRSEPCEICETYSVLKTRAPHYWEWTGPDGRIYDISDFPFIDTDGSLLILEMGIDITARKRAEEAIRQAGAYNRSLIEASLDPLVTISPEGKITDVNRATEKVTGLSRDELIGTDFCDYFTDPGKARVGYQQAFREGGVENYELDICHRGGHITPVVYHASVYRDEQRRVIGVFAAARDITARKRAEESLRQLSAQLLRAQDGERRRIARELHDSFGQQLAALDMNLEWIRQSLGSPDPRVKGVVADCLELVKRCSQEIRDFSYLLHPPMLDDYGLASALRWYAEGFARRTRIQVALDVPDNLPRRSRDVETALFRVAQECLTNVQKHSGSPKASIRLVQEASRLCLEVADQGRAARVPAPGEGVPRPGTGIAGMRERMRELGGTLMIESEGHGMTVRASLPTEEEKAA